MMNKLLTTYILVFFLATTLSAQPNALDDALTIRKVTDIPSWTATRVDYDPATGELYYAAVNGDVYKVDVSTGDRQTVFTAADHGLQEVYGFDIGTSGNIYLVSMTPGSSQNIAVVKKYDGSSWVTMVTATYNTTSYQHRFNAVIETPDQQHILVNSGANTDHGEEHNGKRDYAFTAMMLKFPVSTENLVLQDDEGFMEEYIYAKGLRNNFDMEYDAADRLFGVDQGPQGDHHEELNWLQEGKHYGFPWKMGVYDNPQRFPDYDPNDDLLLLSNGIASIHRNDPTFPDVPDGVSFVEPVTNAGPDQDKYRDPADGLIKDASEDGGMMGSFTPHSSPVGLTFDADSMLADRFSGMAVCVNWSNAEDRKIKPFNAIVEDLLMMDLVRDGENYSASFTRLVEGFNHPVDAALVGNKMYVIEHGENSALWEIEFPVQEQVLSAGVMEQEYGIFVYPNSFSDELNFTFTPQKNGSGNLTVFNLEGKRLIEIWEDSFTANEKLVVTWDGKIGNRDLENGMYLLQFTVGEEKFIRRIIKTE